jgi:hypothetical protein
MIAYDDNENGKPVIIPDAPKPDAELEYRLAKARMKLARQRRQQQRDENANLGVTAAMIVVSILILIISVNVIMNQTVWRHSPPPLQPIPSTPTMTTPHRGPMHGSECGPGSSPDEVCVDVGPLMPVLQCANDGTCPTVVPTPVPPPRH